MTAPRLVGSRALRGPNLWRGAPAVVAELEPRAGDKPALAPDVGESVRRWLDDVLTGGDVCAGATWGAALARLSVGLQRGSASRIAVWCHVSPWGRPGGELVAVDYEEERVALDSIELAHDVLRARAEGREVDLDDVLRELRRTYEREHLGPTASVLVAAARRRGIPVRRGALEPDGSVIQLGLGRHRHRVHSTMTDHTSVIATEVTSDKDRTKRVLRRMGVPVPGGGVAETVEEALDIVRDIGFPALIKPLDANNGRGTSPRLDDEAAVRAAFPRAKAEHRLVVVERYVAGRDHRVLVVAGRVVAVAERVPAHVVGDGVRTIRALADEINADERRSKTDPHAPLAPLPLDEITAEYLARGGRTLVTVPGEGETVFLRSTANISTGGIAIDRTDEIHPGNAAICAFAADITGLDVAGVDVLTPDIGVPFRDNGATIIEVNASPGIRMHTDPQEGTPRDVPGAILDMLFPAGTPAAIPVIAVTGTNGKTTTTRLIAHLFRHAGNRVGFTTTDGVYHQEQLLFEGDMTGPMAADMVLSNPRVDVAVLESARGGILRSGLGYEYCDVGVVLNVSADHLGIGGIETVDQLAAVKAVVVGAVRPGGYAVLNADDARVYAMRARSRGDVALFSLDGAVASPHVAEHVAGGGCAICVEQGTIIAYRGGVRTEVVEVADVPLTLGGAARFQLQNALAATAAGYAAGLALQQIAAALRAFTPSAATTPGRMNVLRLRGSTVIVDYAHNPAAIEALLELVRELPGTRRIGVLAAPGDRQDEDLRAIGRLGRTLDFVVFKEHAKFRRGRAPGETARIMCDALVETGFPAARVGYADGEIDGVRKVAELMRPGDVVAYLADDAGEAIRELDHVSAT